MKGTLYGPGAVHEWLEFEDPDEPTEFWRINVSFFLSNYHCIYGQGCMGTKGDLPRPDTACCAQGTRFVDDDDFENVSKMVEELTEEDCKNLKHVREQGWFIRAPKTGTPYKTRILKDARGRGLGCIFANPEPLKEGDPPMGCSFHHLAERTGRNFNDTKPVICWHNPISFMAGERDPLNDARVTTISAFTATAWGGEDPDPEEGVDDWEKEVGYFDYWCIDTPDAYNNDKAMYIDSKDVLVRMMGENAYARLCELLAQYGERKFPMPGELKNGGKPMIADIVSLNQSLRRRAAEREAAEAKTD